MNSKGIKAMRWHKKSLMDAIRDEGIDIDYIEVVLDSIINNLNACREENSEVNIARNEGYDMGFLAGKALGREPREWQDGWVD